MDQAYSYVCLWMKKRKIYFENLDTLRFFAFFSVFFAHAFYSENAAVTSTETYQFLTSINKIGVLGVNFFFVLSGFLITYLLLIEKEKTGSVSIKNFYARRVLRIWPLYYSIVLVGYVAFPYAKYLFTGNYTPENNLIWYLTFISNLLTEPAQSAILGVLWSIAVEEQFYLIWPLLMWAIPQRSLQYLFPTVVIISTIFRTFYIEDTYGHSLSCMSDLAMGGWIAYAAFNESRLLRWIEDLSKNWIIVAYLIGFSLILTKDYWIEITFNSLNRRLYYSLFFCFIILEQNYAKNSVFKMGKLKVLSYLGQLTYGLYMIHFIAIYIISYFLRYAGFDQSLFHALILSPMLALILSIGLAYLSFQLLERPFLTLKNRFK